jgi:hypothetical protein
LKQAGPRDIVWEKTGKLEASGDAYPFINIPLLLVFHYLHLVLLPLQS